mgnify:CR=1 FL=1
MAARHDLPLGAESEPAADWDPVGPEAIADPHAVHAGLRARCPVAYSDRWGGFYTLTRYADVVQASKDTETFTATKQTVIPSSPRKGLPRLPLLRMLGSLDRNPMGFHILDLPVTTEVACAAGREAAPAALRAARRPPQSRMSRSPA